MNVNAVANIFVIDIIMTWFFKQNF